MLNACFFLFCGCICGVLVWGFGGWVFVLCLLCGVVFVFVCGLVLFAVFGVYLDDICWLLF